MTDVCIAVIRGAWHFDPTPKPPLLRIAIVIIFLAAVVSLTVKSIREEAARKQRRKHKKDQRSASRHGNK